MAEIRLTQVDYELRDGEYRIREGSPASLRGLHAPEGDIRDALLLRLEEGNETYAVEKSPDGRTNETVVFNADQASKGVIFRPSTSYSSARKNPANVLETALAASLNPGAAYVYWGSFGNNPTEPLRGEDRQYLRKTARYTRGDGSEANPYRALDAVKDVVDLLARKELLPTHFIADQEAGRIVLGMMAELEADSVRGVYLNGIDGISDSAKYTSAASLLEDFQSRVHRRRIHDGQPGELTPVNIKDLKRRMPRIYSGLGRVAHLAPLPLILFPRDNLAKAELLWAAGRHKGLDDLEDHAVFQDTSAALRNQKTIITIQFNTDNQKHDVTDCYKFGDDVMNNIPAGLRTSERGLRMLIGDGRITQSTDDPYDYARVQRYALGDIHHPMTAWAGGRLLDWQIFGLQPLKQAS